MRTNSRTWLLPVQAAAILFATFIYVNPFRETATCDDWAYTKMAWHFAETGQYSTHPWMAANPPFQVWWGSLFVTILGKTFVAARLATLALAVAGCLAFMALGRIFGFSRQRSALLALGLLACPLYLRLSFSFMTNVPFLALTLIALWLYAKGLSSGSAGIVLAASAAAAAATLTRQFGLAILPAMVGIWVLEGCRRERLKQILLGSLLPALAGAWQLWIGMKHPPWGALYARTAQSFYMGEHGVLLGNTLTRPGIILLYLTLMVLPFLLLCWRRLWRDMRGGRAAAYVVGALIYLAAIATWSERQGGGAWMPYLPWHLAFLVEEPKWVGAALTVFLGAAALGLGRVLWVRWFADGGWRAMSVGERLMDLTAIAMISMHMLFFQLGDEYILVLVPCALVACGKYLWHGNEGGAARTVVACVLFLLAGAEWTRSSLASEEARWQAAETLARTSVPAEQIYGPWTWIAFHRFDDYLAEYGKRPIRDLKSFWGQWLPEQLRSAKYLVSDSATPPKDDAWRLHATVPYSGPCFQKRLVYVYRRN